MVAVNQQVSLPIGDRVFIFKRGENDCLLLLYENGTEIYGTLFSFIKSGLENDELCIFAYDNMDGKMHLEEVLGEYVEAGKLRLLQMEKGRILRGIEELNSKVCEFWKCVRFKDGKAMRVAMDFGALSTRSTLNSIIGCVRRILQKRGEKIPLNWSRISYKRKNMKSPLPLRVITAFDIDSLTDDAVGRLLELHENVIVSTRNEHRMSLLNYHPPELPSPSPAQTVSRKALERSVKKHLDVIASSLLLRSPMCGYDLIRTIYQKYHTFLSQGTVYPLLYDLERRGLLSIVKSKSPHSKVYTLTEQGKEKAKTVINDFVSAQKYLLESIRK
jgi:DNA-binding PadR family transcriptional regulator